MGDVLSSAAHSPDLTVAYGALPLQVADLYRPAASGRRSDAAGRQADASGPQADASGRQADAASRGLVVLLHGGFWRNRYDRLHLRPLAAALATAGFTVALPEYRRVGDAGGGFPGTFDDVLLAVERVPGLVRSVWGDAALGAMTTLVGHSAGGQLAIWSQAVGAAGTDGSSPDRLSGRVGARREARGGVDRVVSLAGVLDLARAHELGLSSGAVRELLAAHADPTASDSGAAAVGASDSGRRSGLGAVGFADRLRAADPMQLRVPVEVGVETVLVHGVDDAAVPVAFSRDYAARDPRIRFHELAATGHYELIDPSSAAFDVLVDALTRA
jgi:pimeloyl-ACP methyl ester carboxylesterase